MGFCWLVGSAVMAKVKRERVRLPIDYDKGRGASLRALFYAAYDNWMDAGLVNDNLRMHLAQLLGYGSFTELVAANPEEYETAIYALAGPHGFAIYKMLLVQRGMA